MESISKECNEIDIEIHQLVIDNTNSQEEREHKDNVYAKQLRVTKIVLIIILVNYILNTILMGWLGLFSSSFFNYGPSIDLIIPFTHIIVDTWTKYILLCMIIIYNDIVNVVCADLVSPWIFSHVMNGVQQHLGTPKAQTYILIQIYFILTAFTNFAFIGVSSSQIDFFIIGQIGPVMAGFYSVWYYIKNKKS